MYVSLGEHELPSNCGIAFFCVRFHLRETLSVPSYSYFEKPKKEFIKLIYL